MSVSWVHPDWIDEPFDRDMRDTERWERLDDEEAREQSCVDRLRDRGGLGDRPTASVVKTDGSLKEERDAA